MTKTAGVEGTAIVGSDRRYRTSLGGGTVAAAEKYFEKMSVVEEAVSAYQTGLVHAMHDCTEGGVLGALFEVAAASGLGLEVAQESIPVSKETLRVCAVAGADPLKLISSGTLLLAVERGKEDAVLEAIAAAGSSATAIGRFTKGRVVLTKGKSRTVVRTAPRDEIWRLHRRRRSIPV